MKSGFIFAILLAFYALHCGAQTMVWPTTGTSEGTRSSSPFGPRQKASEDYRYDWHRGIDLPMPLGSELYAVTDAVVRIAGEDDRYSDPLVQLLTADGLYINYLHVQEALVTEGQEVSRGDVVALSGESVSGFDHVHFEIREGGANQQQCRNPLGWLPFVDLPDAHTVSLDEFVANNDCGSRWQFSVSASTPYTQLDLNEIRVALYQDNSDTPVSMYTLDFNALTNSVGSEETSTLDDPNQQLEDGVSMLISPARFSSTSETASYTVVFSDVPVTSSLVRVAASAVDVAGNVVTTTIQEFRSQGDITCDGDDGDGDTGARNRVYIVWLIGAILLLQLFLFY